MKPALVVLEVQNDFFQEDNPNLAEFQRVLPKINAAISIFREHNWPVIFVQHTSSSKPVGSKAWEIYSKADCRPEDERINKEYYNAFWKSELDALLLVKQVDFVVVAGFVAEYCVLSTYRGALERGYQAAILQEGIASQDSDERTKFVLDISKSITLDELRE